MNKQIRSCTADFQTREEGNEKYIEGYFAVFNSNYEIAPGMTESIAPGAFTNSLAGDIRALINHDTTLVLGRTAAGTLELREDSRGLWGKVKVNPNDGDAMNLYARVQRGDVSQCSIGFNIRSEDTDINPDGAVHWTINDVELFEVSVCTFPAYTETNISARTKEAEEIKKRSLDAWREKMKGVLNGST